MNLAAWEKEFAGILPRIVEIRRELHRHPELGGEEKRTSAMIEALLRETGAEIHHFADCCGVMGVLYNGEGPCVAVRADMDALPLDENSGCAFPSENPGVMHACGHDVHMALALASCMWLSRNRDRWHGTVKFLFEPAEETFGGSRLMVEQGCLDNPKVDCVIGQHVNPRYKAGTFFSMPGYVSGSSDMLTMTIRGRRSHGAYPEGGVDAIVLAAQVVSALQTLVSRNISPFDPAVITFGTIHGGTANNIICDEVKLVGTLRTLSKETRAYLRSRMKETVELIARAGGGEGDVAIEPGYGAVYNDDRYHALVEKCAAELMGNDMLVRREQASLGVESFCYFVENTPGVFYDLGCGVGTALHTDTFCVDEACLLPGAALQCEAVMNIMKEIEKQ